MTLWLPVIHGCGALYHANPVDAKVIGDCGEYKGLFLLRTPTFLATYTGKSARKSSSPMTFASTGLADTALHTHESPAAIESW